MGSISARATLLSRGTWRNAIGAGLALCVALGIAAHAWHRTLTAEPVTGPQRMTWYRPDGSPFDPSGAPYPAHDCDGDIWLDTAEWRGGVIVPCGGGTAFGAGWAWLDPITRRVELRWPMEGRIWRTRGLIPGPTGELAIVFDAEGHGPLHVGIAAPEGWSRAPERLGGVRYRAAAWVGSKLEVVVTPTTAEDPYGNKQEHTIVTFAGGRRTERRRTGACAEPGCVPPHIVYRAGGRWVFESGGRAVAETGEAVASAVPTENEDYDLDLLAHGRLDVPIGLSIGRPFTSIDADGKASTSVHPWWKEATRTVREHYVIDHRVRRQSQWAKDRTYLVLFEQADGGTLAWDTDERQHLRIAGDPEALSPARPVARWDRRFARQIVYPDQGGGYWMIDIGGERIHLDGALRRTDPLSLREHLRQGGSRGPEVDERTHERYLGWALFGLPILLVAFYLLVAVALGPSAPSRWRPRAGAIAAASGVYALSALIALSRVLPLLG